MSSQTIPVGQLMLDVHNPRLGHSQSQADAILEVIERQGDKLVTLVRSIAENGLSPIENMLVVKEGRNYVVLEGNRRITAIKLLANPDLASGTTIAGAVRKIAKSPAVTVTTVECSVAKNRQEGRIWISLRHRGQAGGAGVVPWGAREATRFETKPGSQAAKALAFLDAVEAGYPTDEVMLDLIEQVGSGRLTTLGRLIADPDGRSQFGYEEESGTGRFRYDAVVLKPLIEKLLDDMATTLTVSKLKSKPQRAKYLKTLPSLNPKDKQADAQPLGDAPAAKTASKKAARKKPKRKPPRLLVDLELTRLGSRVEDILGEIQKLQTDDFPNASAILLRTLLELTVDQFHDAKNWKKSQEFKNRLRKVLREVDPSEKDPKYQNLRVGLQDKSSLYAVSTLHAYVHNAHFHPTATEVRSIAHNLSTFLKAADDLA